jgi:hypothetical protein
MTSPVDLLWRAPVVDLQVVKARKINVAASKPQPALVPQSDEIAPVQPFAEQPSLFLVFADLVATDPTSVISFVKQFGFLGVGEDLVVAGGVIVPGEMLGDWKRHAYDMALAVDLWELRQTVNVKRLARHIKWEKDAEGRHQVVFRSHPEPVSELLALGRMPTTTVIASADKHPELLEQWLSDGFPPGDLGRPALALVQRIIDKRLHRLEESVQPHLAWNANLQRPTLTFTAKTLIGGLWLEFAAAVAADRAFRRCEGCKKWMELGGTDGARPDKRACSPACRAKAHRELQARVRQLCVLGKKSFQDVADLLDVELDLVRKWVTGVS